MKAKFLIHRKIGSAWSWERSHEWGADQSDVFHDLELDDLGGHLNEESEQSSWIQNRLRLVSSVFTHNTEAEKIILASQWLFDSHCGSNELLSFVQTVVAMEILLGDKAVSDLMGLGELLRNRCAYLIGDSQKQREEILDDFRKIYDVRSQIVHRGKSRLTQNERVLFYDLRRMCRRVIQEEVNLLQKDLETPAYLSLIQAKSY